MRPNLSGGRLAPLAGALLLLAGCGQAAAPAPPASVAPRPVASVQELMDAEVDPAADALWDAVAYTADAHGASERRPRTEEDWAALRRSALIMAEAANLLSMPNRQAAPASAPSSPYVLGAAQVQARLQRDHPAFAAYAAALQAVALDAVAAIDARDTARLETVGGRIDETCEACHLQFWYPLEKSN